MDSPDAKSDVSLTDPRGPKSDSDIMNSAVGKSDSGPRNSPQVKSDSPPSSSLEVKSDSVLRNIPEVKSGSVPSDKLETKFVSRPGCSREVQYDSGLRNTPELKSDSSLKHTPETKFVSRPGCSREVEFDSGPRNTLKGKSKAGPVGKSESKFEPRPGCSWQVQSHSDETVSDSDADYDSDQSDSTSLRSQIELLQQQSLLMRKQLTEELLSMPQFREFMLATQVVDRKPSVKRKRSFTPNEPTELRRSARIKNLNPIYTPLDDPEENMYKAKRSRSNSWRNSTSRSNGTSRRNSTTGGDRVIIPVDEITPAHIRNIARKPTDKTHCTISGTSCHQCRQKTLDQKTCCRNADCKGIRGQFCGICLRNRYGEDAEAALRDPNWHCPACRGICNCSYCRIREGNAPTGQLTRTALKKGFTSVKQYLEAKTGKVTEAMTDDVNETKDRTENPDVSGEVNGTSSNTEDSYVRDEAHDTGNVTEDPDIPVCTTVNGGNSEDSHISNEANKTGNSTKDLPKYSFHCSEMNEINKTNNAEEASFLGEGNELIESGNCSEECSRNDEMCQLIGIEDSFEESFHYVVKSEVHQIESGSEVSRFTPDAYDIKLENEQSPFHGEMSETYEIGNILDVSSHSAEVDEVNVTEDRTEESSCIGEVNAVNGAEGVVENPGLHESDNDSTNTDHSNTDEIPDFVIRNLEAFDRGNGFGVTDHSDFSDEESERRLLGYSGDRPVYQ